MIVVSIKPLHLSLELVILFVLLDQGLVHVPRRLRAAAQDELAVLDVADRNQLVADIVDGQFHLEKQIMENYQKQLSNKIHRLLCFNIIILTPGYRVVEFGLKIISLITYTNKYGATFLPK